MDARAPRHRLSARDLEAILGVTTALAQPFDLTTMLAEVVSAAKQVLKADRGSVWLYDPAHEELVLEVATGIPALRVPAAAGLVGACAQSRTVINVPDCYADPRFDPRVDRASGYRTRCMLTLPLIDHRGVLVGVMQVLNKSDGTFDAGDETLPAALAAQCAVALQRVRMTEALIEGERMRQELAMARDVQMSTLPSVMPALPGYDVFGVSRPAEETGGDTFDLIPLERGLGLVLGDATGHGIAPALSVTQMQAMLRMAFRLGADLPTAFRKVNDQLAATLAEDRFITAFIGVLDPHGHRFEFHSGGQGPILHLSATTGACTSYRPTSFPLGAMPLANLRPSVALDMQPGDVVLLISDGVYEYHDPDGRLYGEARVEAIARSHGARPMAELAARILADVEAFARGASQQDDVTLVLAAGALVAGLGYLANDWLIGRLALDIGPYSRNVAPVVEELLKAAVVGILVHSARVGFLVDGAILGFAVGAGFAVVENLYYQQLVPDAGVGTWIVRGFGTAIMHGGATAIYTMATLALLEWVRPRLLAFVPGFAVALVLHSAFNHMFLSPKLSTLAVVAVIPPLILYVFHRSQRAVADWLGSGFDSDAERMELIQSGQLPDSPIGRYLATLKSRFAGPVVADLLCYLRLHTELAMRAKGLLLMRESGFDVPLDDETKAKFEEMRYLEKSIGRTGMLALHPVLPMSQKELWQLQMLGK